MVLKQETTDIPNNTKNSTQANLPQVKILKNHLRKIRVPDSDMSRNQAWKWDLYEQTKEDEFCLIILDSNSRVDLQVSHSLVNVSNLVKKDNIPHSVPSDLLNG